MAWFGDGFTEVGLSYCMEFLKADYPQVREPLLHLRVLSNIVGTIPNLKRSGLLLRLDDEIEWIPKTYKHEITNNSLIDSLIEYVNSVKSSLEAYSEDFREHTRRAKKSLGEMGYDFTQRLSDLDIFNLIVPPFEFDNFFNAFQKVLDSPYEEDFEQIFGDEKTHREFYLAGLKYRFNTTGESEEEN